MCRLLVLAGLLVCAPRPTVGAEEPLPPTAEEIEFFENKIRPVLAERCYACHSSEAKISKGA